MRLEICWKLTRTLDKADAWAHVIITLWNAFTSTEIAGVQCLSCVHFLVASEIWASLEHGFAVRKWAGERKISYNKSNVNKMNIQNLCHLTCMSSQMHRELRRISSTVRANLTPAKISILWIQQTIILFISITSKVSRQCGSSDEPLAESSWHKCNHTYHRHMVWFLCGS